MTNGKNSHETAHSFKVDHGSRLDNSKVCDIFQNNSLIYFSTNKKGKETA